LRVFGMTRFKETVRNHKGLVWRMLNALRFGTCGPLDSRGRLSPHGLKCRPHPAHFSHNAARNGAPSFLVAAVRTNPGRTRTSRKQVPHMRFARVRNDKIQRNGSESQGFGVADAECAAALYIWAAGQPRAAVPTCAECYPPYPRCSLRLLFAYFFFMFIGRLLSWQRPEWRRDLRSE
jgi:hypothetical protein